MSPRVEWARIFHGISLLSLWCIPAGALVVAEVTVVAGVAYWIMNLLLLVSRWMPTSLMLLTFLMLLAFQLLLAFFSVAGVSGQLAFCVR
jgi:hypothetical protein